MKDSTSDISNREIYVIVVQLTNNFNVEERLISAADLPSITGFDICNIFFPKIEELNDSPNKLIAQCDDNGNHMSGVKKRRSDLC